MHSTAPRPVRPRPLPPVARSAMRRLLRVPVFYKVAGANLTVAVALAAGVAWLGGASGLSREAVLGLGAGAAVIASAVLAQFVCRVALRAELGPLEELERVAARVGAGRLDARARVSRDAHPRLAELAAVFNRLLDGLEADQARLREVAARAFRAQESERARVAHELEGETAQSLSAVLLRLRIARRATDPARQARLLDDLRDDLVRLTDQIRDFASMLHSPALAEVGLLAATEAYARMFSARGGPAVSVDGEDVAGLLTPEGELAVYRIVQEALGNVVRHAGAREARVTLRRRRNGVEAVVADDGCGFAAAEVEAERPCPGLYAMRERALFVGGAVGVDSRPGGGTRVTVRVPRAVAAPVEAIPVGHPEGTVAA